MAPKNTATTGPRPPNASSTAGRQPKTLTAIRETAPYVLVAVLYIVVRYQALRGFAHATISISWKEVLLTWPAVLWFYVQHLLFPVHLSEFYALDYVRHATVRLVVLPLLLLFAIAVALYFWIRSLRQEPSAFFALLLIALPLLPVLDLRSLTAGDIAKSLKAPDAKVKKAIKDLAIQPAALAKSQSLIEAPRGDIRRTHLNHELQKVVLARKINRTLEERLANAPAPPLGSQERSDLTDMGHRIQRRSPKLQSLVADDRAPLGFRDVDRLPR